MNSSRPNFGPKRRKSVDQINDWAVERERGDGTFIAGKVGGGWAGMRVWWTLNCKKIGFK